MHANLVKKPHIYIPFLLSLLCFLPSCKDDPRKDVEVETLPSVITVARFDKDFFAMDTSRLEEDLAALKAKYPVFYPFYQQEIMGWRPEEELRNCHLLLRDTNVRRLRDTIDLIFGDFSEQTAILDPAFKRFAYHFPEAPTPTIVLAYTEFLFRSGTDSSLLVLPLEMYLGPAFPVYAYFDIPGYMLRRMDKNHLPVVAMNAWLDEIFGTIPSKNRFLDQLIREGKKQYFLDLVLTETPDSLRTGWDTEQLEWLKKNEFQMWTYYIEDKYLYSTDAAFYMPLLTDGPFTAAPNIPPGSAPRIGAYTGWQIVKRYMEKNPDMELVELLQNMDSDKILSESGYRP